MVTSAAMLPATSLTARILAGAIALAAAAAIGLRLVDLVTRLGMSPLEAVLELSRFLTVLTTVWVVAAFGARAAGAHWPGARGLAALTLALGLVAAGYHLLLSGLLDLAGLGVPADLLFHTVVPAAVALWWLVFAPKDLRFADLPAFLLWPALYTSLALTRGGVEGRFPYPFLDPLAIGWPAVLWTLARFAAALAVAGTAMILLARLLRR